MSVKARLAKLEKQAQPAQKTRFVILWEDGATVDGESLSLAEYEEQARPGDYVIKLGNLKMGDI